MRISLALEMYWKGLGIQAVICGHFLAIRRHLNLALNLERNSTLRTNTVTISATCCEGVC